MKLSRIYRFGKLLHQEDACACFSPRVDLKKQKDEERSYCLECKKLAQVEKGIKLQKKRGLRMEF